MLDTLLKIGKWQKEGKTEWERYLIEGTVSKADRNGNILSNYILPIIFDLDKSEIIIAAENLKDYQESDVLKLKALKIKGGNNKSIYSTVRFEKLIQLYKTLFGKENIDNKKGELLEVVNNNFGSPNLVKILEKIFLLKEKFLDLTTDTGLPKDNRIVDYKIIKRNLNIQNNQKIILLYIAIKFAELGFNEPIALAEIDEYISFLKSHYFPIDQNNKNLQANLCYAEGEFLNDVDSLDLPNRYSLNKMFVTETKNYASFFEKNNFKINYQVNIENQEKLDLASNYLIKNYNIKIANINHIIIPQFFSKEKPDLELILDGIKRKSDILFSMNILRKVVDDIKSETENIFWINFLAFESDGNFFKSTGLIKDVSQFQFDKIIKVFTEVNWEFKDYNFCDWDSIMTEYGISDKYFNLNTVYNLIPIRKDKEKKNKALELFKAILENRKISNNIIYKYFSELMLCHYYKRYKSYTNIANSSKDYFYITIRDCVFKYLAFSKVLKKLNLINMEEENINLKPEDNSGNKYEKAINDFFEKMALNENQKAMFYLGRMLKSVDYIQKDKNKTVIDKVNYNGMDRDNISRLRISLFEKAKQYNKIQNVIFDDAKFNGYFKFQEWNMDPNEALFFILTGFSFGLKPKEENTNEN